MNRWAAAAWSLTNCTAASCQLFLEGSVPRRRRRRLASSSSWPTWLWWWWFVVVMKFTGSRGRLCWGYLWVHSKNRRDIDRDIAFVEDKKCVGFESKTKCPASTIQSRWRRERLCSTQHTVILVRITFASIYRHFRLSMCSTPYRYRVVAERSPISLSQFHSVGSGRLLWQHHRSSRHQKFHGSNGRSHWNRIGRTIYLGKTIQRWSSWSHQVQPSWSSCYGKREQAQFKSISVFHHVRLLWLAPWKTYYLWKGDWKHFLQCHAYGWGRNWRIGPSCGWNPHYFCGGSSQSLWWYCTKVSSLYAAAVVAVEHTSDNLSILVQSDRERS